MPVTTRQDYKTYADRLLWIVRNRPKTADGRPMSRGALSLSAGLSRAFVSLLLAKPESRDVLSGTAEALAWAGQVSLNWLNTGRGSPEDPDVPEHAPPASTTPKHRTYGDYPDWEIHAQAACELELLEKGPELLAGAALRVMPGNRPPSLSPEIVQGICFFAWRTSSANRRGAYEDAWQELSARIAARRASRAKPLAVVVGESGFPPERRRTK